MIRNLFFIPYPVFLLSCVTLSSGAVGVEGERPLEITPRRLELMKPMSLNAVDTAPPITHFEDLPSAEESIGESSEERESADNKETFPVGEDPNQTAPATKPSHPLRFIVPSHHVVGKAGIDDLLKGGALAKIPSGVETPALPFSASGVSAGTTDPTTTARGQVRFGDSLVQFYDKDSPRPSTPDSLTTDSLSNDGVLEPPPEELPKEVQEELQTVPLESPQGPAVPAHLAPHVRSRELRDAPPSAPPPSSSQREPINQRITAHQVSAAAIPPQPTTGQSGRRNTWEEFGTLVTEGLPELPSLPPPNAKSPTIIPTEGASPPGYVPPVENSGSSASPLQTTSSPVIVSLPSGPPLASPPSAVQLAVIPPAHKFSTVQSEAVEERSRRGQGERTQECVCSCNVS